MDKISAIKKDTEKTIKLKVIMITIKLMIELIKKVTIKNDIWLKVLSEDISTVYK